MSTTSEAVASIPVQRVMRGTSRSQRAGGFAPAVESAAVLEIAAVLFVVVREIFMLVPRFVGTEVPAQELPCLRNYSLSVNGWVTYV